VHPAQAGIRSDLHLITTSGHVYSFLLTEISKDSSAEPDLKLFVEPKEGSSLGAATPLQGYVRASEVEAYKKELDALHTQLDAQVHAAQAQAEQQVNKFKADYQKALQFDYELDKNAAREPFLVSMIYHDDAFTYIKCAAPEKPALYEVKDGKPNLVNFQVENGVYIAPKVIDEGYLAVGNRKLTFKRHN
jgi:type IV secretion system protein VirB9